MELSLAYKPEKARHKGLNRNNLSSDSQHFAKLMYILAVDATEMGGAWSIYNSLAF